MEGKGLRDKKSRGPLVQGTQPANRTNSILKVGYYLNPLLEVPTLGSQDALPTLLF